MLIVHTSTPISRQPGSVAVISPPLRPLCSPVGAGLGLLRLEEEVERLLEGGLGRLAEDDLGQFTHGPRYVGHGERPHTDQVPVGRVLRPVLAGFLSASRGEEGERLHIPARGVSAGQRHRSTDGAIISSQCSSRPVWPRAKQGTCRPT